MSRGHNPLLWMMACAVPTAGHALGLGEIHVDSALNEPLAAEIDIVGAEPEELVGLIATVANRDTFAHFGAERPAFLNNTTFKVTKDARGKPILSIRSSESFTEPLIDFVVDLRWRNGQLIRQYSLLLDPAGYPSATQVATALPAPPQSVLPAPVVSAPSGSAPIAAAPVATARATTGQAAAAPVAAAPVATRAPSTDAAASGNDAERTITVGAKATLHGIALRAGARSAADQNRMMIAIFRANPSAFNGNINRLRMGATLRIPSAEEVSAISAADANRETHAQVREWRESTQHSYAASFASRASAAAATATNAPAAAAPSSTAAASTVGNGAATTSAAPANAAPASAAPANAAPASAAPANAAAANAAPGNTVPASAATATVAANAASASEATTDRAALETKILSLEGTLQDIQAQLQAQQDKLSKMQAQERYTEQHPKVVVAPAASAGDRGLLRAALGGMALLAGACIALLIRLRRRAKTNALPSIEKVPLVAPVEAMAPLVPAAKPKPAAAPAFAPEASRIEVQELPLPLPVQRTEVRPEPRQERPEPMESALELSSGDTAGINAAQLREELAAAKLREEIAAAWALPAAESYQREEFDPENTLAQDIAKSLEDTLALQAAMTGTYGEVPASGDTVETLQQMGHPGDTAETLLQAGYPGDTVETLTHVVGIRGQVPDGAPTFEDRETHSHDANETRAGDTRTAALGHTGRFSATEFPPQANADDYPGEFDGGHLDYDFLEMGETHDTVNMKGHAEDATKSATDRIKVSGDVKAAAEKLELGADDPKLSPHDPNFANCA